MDLIDMRWEWLKYSGSPQLLWSAIVIEYNRYQEIVAELADIHIPAIPHDSKVKAPWEDLYEAWYFETEPPFEGSTWVRDDLVLFNEGSPFCSDLAQCPAMKEVEQQFQEAGPGRKNPWFGAFHFRLKASCQPGYYTIVEWFLGSFDTTVQWTPLSDGRCDVRIHVHNQSDWHSASRLPKSWQDKIRKATGMDIADLVSPAPRGQVTDLLLQRALDKVLNLSLAGCFVPRKWLYAQLPHLRSFGGTFEQQFTVKTIWQGAKPRGGGDDIYY